MDNKLWPVMWFVLVGIALGIVFIITAIFSTLVMEGIGDFL